MKKIIYLLIAITFTGFLSAVPIKKGLPQEEEMEEQAQPSREGEVADRNRNNRERNDISLYEKNERRLERQAERNRQKLRCQRCRPYYNYPSQDEYDYE